jgi:Helix-turn-helix domain/MarR family
MPGSRLTEEDRRNIAAGLAEGLGYTDIGQRLRRPASTIMREVARNGGPEGYRADQAHEATRHRARRPKQTQAAVPPVPSSVDGRDTQVVQDFSRSLTALIEKQGMPRMAAKVLVSLCVTDSAALTAADLVQQLGVSPASVSHAVTFLEQQGMILRERTPGERRERYVVDEGIWLRSILTTVQRNDDLVAASQRGVEILGATTPAGARFAYSADFLQFMSDLFRYAMEQWRQNPAPGPANVRDVRRRLRCGESPTAVRLHG